MSAKVKVDRQETIVTLTLNRPEVHNALDAELIDSLSHELRVHAGDVKAVILRGAGRSFCAGADLAYMEKAKDFTEKENLEDARQLAGLFHEIRTFPGVVVAAVQGAAIGGGVGLVAACDVVLASRRARFQLSEVRLGLIPAVISPFLIERMGQGACRAPVLLGHRFHAEEALRRGLVDRLVEVEDFEESIENLIEEIALTAPKALEEAKGLLHRISAGIVKDVFEDTARTIARIRVGKEAQEGLSAFLEKREPSWRLSSDE
jgi:methylglutaconyl-CoA hydratase